MSEDVETENTEAAEATPAEATDAVEAIGEAPAKKKMAGKTLVLFVILPALFVIIGGGTAAMMLLGGGKAEAASAEAKDEGDHGEEKAKDKGDKKGKEAKADDHGQSADEGTHDAPGIKKQIGASGEPSFYTLPDMLVNLNSSTGRAVYLKLKLTFESDDPHVFDQIDPILPRVMDQFQMFLRELRIEDLDGTAGQYRLRRELLRRVNLAINPAEVDAVLIEEMLVQ